MTDLRVRKDGRFASGVDNDELLSVVNSMSDATTEDIREKFGYTKNGALKRLKKAEEAGLLSKSEINGGFVWHLTDEGKRELAEG